MAEINWSELSAVVTYLSTELDGLVASGNKLGAAIDNSAGKMRALLELDLAAQGAARDADAAVEVYAIKSIDGGTTFEYGGDSLDPAISALIGVFSFDAATDARVGVIDVAIPPGTFKMLLINQTGQAFAASGSTLKYALYSPETN